MNLSLFDLHCDTANEMLSQKQSLESNSLAVSLQKASCFTNYVQVMAHWTSYELNDEEGWSRFLEMCENLKKDPAILSGKAHIVTSVERSTSTPQLLLAVEDARILANQESRVQQLYDMGVRILTPLWAGLTCIGGSHNTEAGLTKFGRFALRHAVSLGMILDISHASEQSAQDMFETSSEFQRPVIASHSNAYGVCPVSRNLRDWQIQAILKFNGIIGLNLYRGFLSADKHATAKDVVPHIEYFLAMGAEKNLALGCDMDGCDLPKDVPDVSTLPHLAELMLQQNYPESLIHDVFYGNAIRFFQKYLR